jgi:hypothetical protein
MKNIVYILALTLLTTCSFHKEKYNSIIIGYYCGECVGDCFQGYYISGDSVFKLSAHNIDSIDIKKKIVLTDKKEIKKIKEIETLLPSNLIRFPHEIGTPDNRDQCGIYIRAKFKGLTREILIDPDKPERFKKLTIAIKNLALI